MGLILPHIREAPFNFSAPEPRLFHGLRRDKALVGCWKVSDSSVLVLVRSRLSQSKNAPLTEAGVEAPAPRALP